MRFVLGGVVIGCWLAVAPAAGAADNQRGEEPGRVLVLKPGDTLSACQSFYWRDSPRAARYWMRVGSCRYCGDIASREVTGSLSAEVSLPADGRPIYFALHFHVNGRWETEEHRYRAPTSKGAAEACGAAPKTSLGVYHWAGAVTRSMAQGVEQIAGLGGRSVRVSLSARYLRDYNIADACYSGFTLAKALEEADIRRALGDPRIDTFMITAFDGTSFGDCWTQRFLSASFYTEENRQALIKEYEDFAYGLVRAHAGSGKQFIVSNWESDNAVYCGAAYRYVHDLAFRRSCDENYAKYYGGNRDPGETMLALREWFAARRTGIERGQRRARAEGFYGVSVYSAPEINIVRALADNGFASVLYDVLPHIEFDFVSYSSWESINRADFAVALPADLDTIRTVANVETVIIGELGAAASTWGASTAGRIEEALGAAERWGAPYVFHWVLYDYNPDRNEAFGLFDLEGRITPLGRFYRSRLAEAFLRVGGHSVEQAQDL